jgi:hypothetical protein
VALRAALESAVQLGRGDEVNRVDEMANPLKGRDSLKAGVVRDLRVNVHMSMHGHDSVGLWV